MRADRLERFPEPLQPLAIQLGPGGEPLRATADDCQHQRQAIAGGADDRLRAAADGNPRAQATRLEWRIDHLSVERRAQPSAPGYRLLRQNRGKQLELFA